MAHFLKCIGWWTIVPKIFTSSRVFADTLSDIFSGVYIYGRLSTLASIVSGSSWMSRFHSLTSFEAAIVRLSALMLLILSGGF